MTAVTATLLLLAGCSSVDRGPTDECQDVVDCGTGRVCSSSQGNICVPEKLPPRAAIGFEISDGDVRVELRGCDPEVTQELGGSELRVQRRTGLVRDYRLRASTRRSVADCSPDTCAGVCDEASLTCSEPTDVDFTLTLASRLGQSELRTKKTYVSVPPNEGDVAAPVGFTTPIYDAAVHVDPLAHAARVLDITPTGEPSTLSSYRRALADDAPTELESTGVLRCQRGLFGVEGGVRRLSGAPVINAGVEFRYGEPIASPSTVLGSAPSCSEDQPCPPGWSCNVQGSCGLDLTDTLAGQTTSVAELVGGFPEAWVYTYCEGLLAPLEPLFRTFTVTVTPPAESGLPTVLYTLDQGFLDPPNEGFRKVEVDGQLCLPDWQPPQTVAFSVVGEPVTLARTALGDYACCTTACLPSGAPDVEPTPPPTVDSCSSFDRVRFETRWFNPDVTQWLFAGCVPTASYPDGANGRFRVELDKCEDQGCAAALTPGAVDDLIRTYTVWITQPVGSVFQSQKFTVQLDAETTELPPFELLPRVLLRGRVSCKTEDNCSREDAVVWAERLRVETDESDLLGQFFFQARVDANGEFVVPVDPGVYVVTALPAVGERGGPAPFLVVDTRAGSSAVKLVDGVPTAQLDDRLQLDAGVLVRVALDGFPVSTGVTPLDVGSWTTQSDFPADLDLNDPLTCYAADTSGKQVRRGCSVRRLRPTTAAPLSLISKKAQFTARDRGDDRCE